MRFNELKRSMPSITQKMLTQQLKALEENKLINKKVYNEVPPKVEYSLTDYGKSLLPVLKGLCNKIICFYGSRIRDYLDVKPSCPSLLIFARYDSFDVDKVIKVLKEKKHTRVKVIEAKHGFMDKYGYNFNDEAAEVAIKYMKEFF